MAIVTCAGRHRWVQKRLLAISLHKPQKSTNFFTFHNRNTIECKEECNFRDLFIIGGVMIGRRHTQNNVVWVYVLGQWVYFYRKQQQLWKIGKAAVAAAKCYFHLFSKRCCRTHEFSLSVISTARFCSFDIFVSLANKMSFCYDFGS